MSVLYNHIIQGDDINIISDTPSTGLHVPDTNVGELISRQWLMECVNEGWIKFDTEKDENRFKHLVRDIAPSVQPERKRGKWRRRLVDSGFNADWHCSECGWKTSIEEHGYNFCPTCGADMREGDSE